VANGRLRFQHNPDRFGNKPKGEEYPEGIMYPGPMIRAEVIVPDYLPDTPGHSLMSWRSIIRLLTAWIRGFGKLFEVLKEAGQWENTIIIFMSDNGIAFPGAKTNLYDPAMRLPLLISYPAMVEKGSVSDAMINWTYMTPTTFGYSGICYPKTVPFPVHPTQLATTPGGSLSCH
jgi:N-sulfoglucosamine sulfohydrolase